MNDHKRCLITGITGQTGSYAAELLLEKGYDVYGMKRRTSTDTLENIRNIEDKITIIEGDLADQISLNKIVKDIKPDELYSYGAQSITEDCLCPILFTHKLDYVSLGKIWQEILKKDKRKVTKEVNNNIEIEVIDMPDNLTCRALGMWNGMGTWFPITQLSRHKWKGKVAKLSQKFGSVIVTPNHSLLDINNKICMPEENPWLLNIRKLNYQNNIVNEKITLKVSGSYEFDNKYMWKSQHGNDGKILRILDEDNLAAFCNFLGAFIGKGHTTYNKANDSYFVGISNNNKKWLNQLENDIRKFYFGNICYVEHKKEGYEHTWEIQLNSCILYSLLRELCGTDSHTKSFPYWFSYLQNDNLLKIWQKMLEGNGCIDNGQFYYTTTSYKLACQLSMIYTMLGYDYIVNEEYNNKYKCNYWHFRQCASYQPNQGSNEKKIEWLDYDGWVYDITVKEVHNFAVGVGNIVVHNSHVKVSFEQPELTGDITGLGVLRLLEAIKEFSPKTRFYNSATSELFGSSPAPQNEDTIMIPRSPYGCAKMYAYCITRNYREAYNLFACSGITFNHESPKRGADFVTRKITQAAAKIKLGIQNELFLGNLDAKRDITHAKDVVVAQWLMLQNDTPKDYVISSGSTHSIKDMLDVVFNHLNLNWKEYVKIDPAFYRPSEVHVLCGDYEKIKKELGWEPKTNWKDLLIEMVEYDLSLLKNKQ